MIVSQRQAVSLHTRSGVQLYQYLPENITGGNWTRELRDTSKLTLSLPPDDHLDRLDLQPWLHWCSVFDDQDVLLWTGPLQQAVLSRSGLQITARDCSVFASKTRVPMTKSWDATDPAMIALELWQDMIDLHHIPAEPIVKLDPYGGKFEYSVTEDTKLVSDVINDLVNLGLKWTVVGGIPILGPAPRDPLASLGSEHFLGDGLTLTRDGTSTYNDVLLMAGDSNSFARVPMAGLNLQQIVTADGISGVSNADRAAYEAARYYSTIRNAITLPGGSMLSPDAPLDIHQLIPSIRVYVEGYGEMYQMELDSVAVTMGSGSDSGTAVSLESAVDDLPEVATLNSTQTNVSTTGGVGT